MGNFNDWSDWVEITTHSDTDRVFKNIRTGMEVRTPLVFAASTATLSTATFSFGHAVPILTHEMVAWKCRYCGRKIKDGAEFCEGCGAPCE